MFAAGIVIAHRLGHGGDALKPILTAAACLATATGILRALQRYVSKHALVCVTIIAAFATGDLRLNNGPNESTALSAARYDFLKRNCQNETILLLKARLKQPSTSSRRDRVELVGLGFAWPNVGLIHGFDHDLGYNPLRIEAVSEAIGAGDTIAGWDQRQFTPLFPSYRSLLADLLGLRYIASAVPVEQVDRNLKPGDLIQIGRTKDAYVYENPRALPGVMFVGDWMLADFAALISTGAWPRFDPTRTVLLETEPAGPTLQPVALSNEPAGVATFSHYENTIVEVDVTATRAGFVLLNSAWHPGGARRSTVIQLRSLKRTSCSGPCKCRPAGTAFTSSSSPWRELWPILLVPAQGSDFPDDRKRSAALCVQLAQAPKNCLPTWGVRMADPFPASMFVPVRHGCNGFSPVSRIPRASTRACSSGVSPSRTPTAALTMRLPPKVKSVVGKPPAMKHSCQSPL